MERFIVANCESCGGAFFKQGMGGPSICAPCGKQGRVTPSGSTTNTDRVVSSESQPLQIQPEVSSHR